MPRLLSMTAAWQFLAAILGVFPVEVSTIIGEICLILSIESFVF